MDAIETSQYLIGSYCDVQIIFSSHSNQLQKLKEIRLCHCRSCVGVLLSMLKLSAFQKFVSPNYRISKTQIPRSKSQMAYFRGENHRNHIKGVERAMARIEEFRVSSSDWVFQKSIRFERSSPLGAPPVGTPPVGGMRRRWHFERPSSRSGLQLSGLWAVVAFWAAL